MDEGKVGSVKDVIEVVVIVVHLDGGELTLVYNVGRGERADVEGVGQAADAMLVVASEECRLHLVRRLLAEDVELPQKVSLVKRSVLALLARSIVLLEHDERLEDFGLFAPASGSEDRVVGRYLSPSEHTQFKRLCDRLECRLLRGVLFGREEEVSDRIVTFARKRGGEGVSAFSDEEIVWDASHDTCSISVTSIGSGW